MTPAPARSGMSAISTGVLVGRTAHVGPSTHSRSKHEQSNRREVLDDAVVAFLVSEVTALGLPVDGTPCQGGAASMFSSDNVGVSRLGHWLGADALLLVRFVIGIVVFGDSLSRPTVVFEFFDLLLLIHMPISNCGLWQLLDYLMYTHQSSTPDSVLDALVSGLLYKPDASSPDAARTAFNSSVFGTLSELCCTPHRGIVLCASNVLWVRQRIASELLIGGVSMLSTPSPLLRAHE